MAQFSMHQIECGKCRKLFDINLPEYINEKEDFIEVEKLKNQKLLEFVCPHCGFCAQGQALFLYFDPSKGRLFLVTPINTFKYYSYLKYMSREYEKMYCKQNLLDEKMIIHRHIIPLPFFYHLLNNENEFHLMGTLHFSPVPQIDYNKIKTSNNIIGQAKFSDKAKIEITNSNIPDIWKKIIKELLPIELFYKHYLPDYELVPIVQKPTAAYGIEEILITISNSVILPVIVGILSNLITSLITERKKTNKEIMEKDEVFLKKSGKRLIEVDDRSKKILEFQDNSLKPSDVVSLRIIDTEQAREFKFSGSYSKINRLLKDLRTEALLSININGVCHVSSFYGSTIIDRLIDDKVHDLKELGELYRKHLSSDTRVKFVFIFDKDTSAKYYDQINRAQEAQYLMDKQNYEMALEILDPAFAHEETSIEIFYNAAICLKELGYYDQASDMFERVIIESINRLSLDEFEILVTGFEDKKLKEILQQKILENYNEDRKSITEEYDAFLNAIKEKYKDL